MSEQRQDLQMPEQPADPNRFSPIHDSLDGQLAQYKKLRETRSTLDKVRKELDELMELGDMVTPEDVIGAAGRLVGHGLEASAMAELLADMPVVGGEALASWIGIHDQLVTEREQQLEAVMQEAAHHLGVTGLRTLMADHVMQKTGLPVASTTAGIGTNQLGGSSE